MWCCSFMHSPPHTKLGDRQSWQTLAITWCSPPLTWQSSLLSEESCQGISAGGNAIQQTDHCNECGGSGHWECDCWRKTMWPPSRRSTKWEHGKLVDGTPALSSITPEDLLNAMSTSTTCLGINTWDNQHIAFWGQECNKQCAPHLSATSC